MTEQMILEASVMGFTLMSFITACIYDIHTRKIPNILTFGSLIAGLVMIYLMDWQEGIVRTLAITALFFVGATGCLGLGDLKLVMALTALQGVLPTLITLFIASSALLIVKVIKGKYKVDMQRLKDADKAAEGEKVPFAPYMLVGYASYLAYFVIDRFIQ